VSEVVKLISEDAAADDFGGFAVALSGNRAMYGAVYYDEEDIGNDAGAVYVFDRDAEGLWHETAELVPPSGNVVDIFGNAIALEGDRAVIGAWKYDANARDSGAAFVFEFAEGIGWRSVATLAAGDGAFSDSFGYSVSLSGHRALIGAAEDDGPGEKSGSAYIFERQPNGSWVEVAKLRASNPGTEDFFGRTVSLSGNQALIGAPGDSSTANSAGAAYVFERDVNGVWNEVAKLTASDEQLGARFGWSISTSKNQALISAPYAFGDGAKSGAAYVFEKDINDDWTEVAKLAPNDGGLQDQFGYSVSISGKNALIGARADDNPETDTGSAYAFQRDANGVWSQLAKIKPSNGAEGDLFGYGVSLEHDKALIGSVFDDQGAPGAGAAYVFDLEPLSAEGTEISVSAGGTQTFEINAGHLYAGMTYQILGSYRGTDPGVALPNGKIVPVNEDAYFHFTVESPNTPPLFSSMGVLDAAGRATASFSLPPNSDPSLAGKTVHHAFVVHGPGGLRDVPFVSNPVAVKLVP
jgi:hypothetical protein